MAGRIPPHGHVGLHEIAVALGVTRQAVAKWRAADPAFPPPAARLKGQDVWHTDDVVAWAKTSGRRLPD